MEKVWIMYNGESVFVEKEVADFLSQDEKRLQAQARSDRRHLSYSELNQELLPIAQCVANADHILDRICKNYENESLQKAVSTLSSAEQNLLYKRYYLELTQQQIADMLGLSKMAVCKRLKKLHEKLGA